jgi:putative ABC transport system ATP-binding protein
VKADRNDKEIRGSDPLAGVEPHAIEIDHVGVRYDGRWVLKDFSLGLARGEKVTLTGPSGAGKSTVLRCVLGLVVPQEGSVRVFGRPVDERHVWQVRRQLAYVAQEPDLGAGTAREVLERPFHYKANAPLRGNLGRTIELLERFCLPAPLLDKEIATLSGGEKQRIALISAILLDRPVVLLDEASSALDRENKQAVAGFFREVRDLTVLSVSHDTEWQAFSERVVHLSRPADGREEQT